METDHRSLVSQINYIFNEFNENTFVDIKLSIYNNPTAVYYISPKSLSDLMEITFKRIKLLNSIFVIKYYDELRVVGWDNDKAAYNLYTLPDNFEHIMAKLGIVFENTTCLNIQETQLDTIDYYVSTEATRNIKWEFDNNGHKIYTIF